MNRRKFIVAGAIGATAVSMVPSTALSNNTLPSTADLGEGFKMMSQSANSIDSSLFMGHFSNTLDRLVETLSKEGYIFNQADLFKMGDRCYGLPVQYPSLLGSNSQQLALIVEQNEVSSNFIIMNQKLTQQMNELALNFSIGMEGKEDILDVNAFAVPYKVNSFKSGRYQELVFINKFSNKIVLNNDKKTAQAIIC